MCASKSELIKILESDFKGLACIVEQCSTVGLDDTIALMTKMTDALECAQIKNAESSGHSLFRGLNMISLR